MELLTAAIDSSECMLPPYGLQQHPLLWGHNSYDSPAASEDCDSIMSDLTELTAPYLSRPARRTRKQECPTRAPMYSNTGAVTDAYQLQQHCAQKTIRPTKPHKQPVISFPAVAVSKGRVLHGAAAAARNSKRNNPCSGPCDNCGATNSPQWRHGSKSKPIVCNACGIRFLRTGSFDKAVDKKRCATPNSAASGPRPIKRSKVEGATTSIEDEEQPATSGPTPMGSDGGQSCIDSRAAATAEPATTSRRTATPPVDDGCVADATAAIFALNSKSDQVLPQEQQYLNQQTPQLPGSCVSSAGVSTMISPASTSTSYHPGAQPNQLALGPAAVTANNSSSNRMITTGSSSGRTGQQQRGSRAAASNHGCGISRHGPSPLSVASNGQVANRPSRFGAPVAALQAYVAATSGGKSSMKAPAITGKVLRAGAVAGVAVSAGTVQCAVPLPLLAGTAVVALKGTGAASRTSGTATGAAPAAAISPELIQMVQRLAGVLGSVDAAIAFIKSLGNKNSSNSAVAAGSGVTAGEVTATAPVTDA